MTWRENARPIIAKCLADNKDKSEKEIKKALQECYPYGQRSMHPYKIWCDEIKVQRNLKKTKHNHNFDFNQVDLFKESEVNNG
jgi:Leu/Phe-tRNA-protein transferase